MISYDFWLAMLIVWAGSLVLIFTAIKFIMRSELRYRIVGFGLISISIALFLNGLFYLFYLFTGIYWVFVEIFHIIGIILITMGILSSSDEGGTGDKRKVKE